MELTDLKNKLAIDSDVFNSMWQLSLDAAEAMIQGAVGAQKPEFYKGNKLYEMAVVMLTDHFFKNRSATTTGNIKETPLGVQSIILQLKPAYRLFKGGGDSDADS